ncbi:MAG: DUF1311 domain-containing protein [Pseudobutyrivibrio sp.]|nr:DUF1311 domain-containing protein [Pseudobutyrivibrio sp.]
MRKRRRRGYGLSIALICIAIILVGVCIIYFVLNGNKGSDANTAAVDSQTGTVETVERGDSDSEAQTDDSKKAEPGNSIQKDLEAIEEKNSALNDTDTSDMTQFEMNTLAGERYSLWDDELNSIWSRLTEQISASEKETLVKEQQAWIKRKDGAMDVAVIENGGGSIGPLLRAEEGADLTRVRVYYLAEKLADAMGETFEVSEDVQNELDNLDYTLEDTLELLEGQWIFDVDSGAVIGIERTEGDADGEWDIWTTGGGSYTEKDIYAYNGNCIVLHKADDEDSGYDVIQKWDDCVYSWYGHSLEDLMSGIDDGSFIAGY